jgi:hypothetical protein
MEFYCLMLRRDENGRIHKVVPYIKAGEVGSQAVYPLAKSISDTAIGKARGIWFLLYQCAPPNFLLDHCHHKIVFKKASCVAETSV